MLRLMAFIPPRYAANCVTTLAFAIVCCMETAPLASAEVSNLWGQRGELWSAESRLPDFSFAGYRRGEEPYRVPTERVSIKSYGAKGDGRTDDTEAFRQAIATGGGKVIEVPAGRYVLSDQLVIQSSNLVLRGAGSEATALVFTKSLEEIKPSPARTDGGKPTSGWSWGGGLITIGDRSTSAGLATKVMGEAKRGDNQLMLESAIHSVGDEIVLTLHDNRTKSLVTYLYHGGAGDISGLNRWTVCQVFRVKEVDGNRITLDRGLRFDVREEWEPTVAEFTPDETDVGIEGVSFEFPATEYGGHFKEVGYNPVEISSSAAHCWLRDIRIHNADSGPYVRGTFCTLDGIRLTADAGRVNERRETGHHGITFYGNDCLCTNFSIETRFIHDLTVQSAIGCVFASGRAVDLSMDHHRWAPYENLFTDIDGGEGRRLFSSSGGLNRGNHTAAGATFWNIRAERPCDWPRLGNDSINVVAVTTEASPVLESNGRWFEPIPPNQIQPADLHQAMCERRLRE